MNTKNIAIIIIIAVIVLGGGYFLMKGENPKPVVENTNQETDNIVLENTTNQNGADNGVTIEVAVPKTYEIMYTDAGYGSTPLTIKVGDTVTWKNQSTQANWVGSAMHPNHILYSGTTLQEHCPDVDNSDFDQCQADKNGDSWSFTFKKAGTWGYHNHMNVKHFGKIIVE